METKVIKRWLMVLQISNILLLPALSLCQEMPASSNPSSEASRAEQLGAPQPAPPMPSLGEGELRPGGSTIEDLLLQKGVITMDEWIQIRAEQEYRGSERDKRLDALEDWKTKVELLPILRDKVNFGLNALQFLYTHQDAHVPEGKSQDNFSIRRSEIIFWGRLSDTLPRWHALFEFQSISFGRETPTGGSGAATGQPIAATFFRESYIDYRPLQSWAPYLNFIRMGIFRMPFGIFTETSGGLRDVISSPYLTSVGSGLGNRTGSAGAIDFLQERDFFVDMRGRLFNRLEYVAGVMNNNNFHANATGANAPKSVYSRVRLFGSDISFVSFTVIAGESNNANTNINGRGKGSFDRYGIDFRYTSKIIPGFMVQGEYWQGHDGANQTTVGRPANGACDIQAICGGSGAPGVQRRTWYVLAKYLITDGPFENFEPVVMYEQFDPNTRVGHDLYTRTIVGLTYYFENFPPKVQSKLQVNYEFRHHSGNGPGNPVDPTAGIGDPFAQNAFLVQWQIRFM
jgi:hypothetical protein